MQSELIKLVAKVLTNPDRNGPNFVKDIEEAIVTIRDKQEKISLSTENDTASQFSNNQLVEISKQSTKTVRKDESSCAMDHIYMLAGLLYILNAAKDHDALLTPDNIATISKMNSEDFLDVLRALGVEDMETDARMFGIIGFFAIRYRKLPVLFYTNPIISSAPFIPKCWCYALANVLMELESNNDGIPILDQYTAE